MAKNSGGFWKTLGAVVLGVALVAGATGGAYALTNYIKEKNNEEEKVESSMIVTPEATTGRMALTAKRIATAANDEVSAQANEAYTISATISPVDATNKSVDWSVAFANPASSWTQGKKVTDYVTITPTSDGALTATLSCVKAFGEQIIISCTSRFDSTISANCTVDYVKRVIDDGFSANGKKEISSYVLSNADELLLNVSPTYGDGTLSPTISYNSLYLTFNTDFAYYLGDLLEEATSSYNAYCSYASNHYYTGNLDYLLSENDDACIYDSWLISYEYDGITSEDKAEVKPIVETCIYTAINKYPNATHAYLNVSYDIIYSGDVYQTVTAQIPVNFSAEGYEIAVTGIDLNNDSYIL